MRIIDITDGCVGKAHRVLNTRARQRRGWQVLLLCVCACLAYVPAASAQTAFGACPIEAYQTIKVGSSFDLYTVDVGTGVLTNQGTSAPLQGINAIGFNESDRFIYGWNQTTKRIVRVGQNGVAAYVGTGSPAGMSNFSAFVGDVTGGKLYLLGGTGVKEVRVVNLSDSTVQSHTVTGNTAISDWAVNPIDGLFYGVQNDGTIISIDPGTWASTTVTSISVPGGAAFGAIYFDSQGSLYASRNNGSIFRVRNLGTSKPKSVQTLTAAAPNTSTNDGARCPNALPPLASISVRKELIAESGTIAGRAEANEVLTYEFTLTNSGTLAASNYPFFEVLPANTTLLSVTGGSTDCPVNSAGARLCTITVNGSILPGGTASATMTVRVANPIPSGVTQILNTITDDNGTPPSGCPGTNQPCTSPPSCDANADPEHCVILPLPSADLLVSKTNNATSVTTGTQTTYDIVVSNTGPDAANGAILTDPAPTGLDSCVLAAVACTASGGAACPTQGAGTGQLSVANLQGAGVVIPTLPNGGSVTVHLTCTVQ